MSAEGKIITPDWMKPWVEPWNQKASWRDMQKEVGFPDRRDVQVEKITGQRERKPLIVLSKARKKPTLR